MFESVHARFALRACLAGVLSVLVSLQASAAGSRCRPVRSSTR